MSADFSMNRPAWSIPALIGGVAGGIMLAIFATLAHARSGISPVTVLVAILPFILAAVTGVAKTTTA